MSLRKRFALQSYTVDGRNPAPPGMLKTLYCKSWDNHHPWWRWWCRILGPINSMTLGWDFSTINPTNLQEGSGFLGATVTYGRQWAPSKEDAGCIHLPQLQLLRMSRVFVFCVDLFGHPERAWTWGLFSFNSSIFVIYTGRKSNPKKIPEMAIYLELESTFPRPIM